MSKVIAWSVRTPWVALSLVMWLLVGCQPSVEPDTTPPAEVASLGATAKDACVDLVWADPTDPDLDRVEVTVTPGDAPRAVAGPGANAICVEGLVNGTAYTFLIQAVDKANNRSTGVSVQATPVASTVSGAPGEVTDLAALAGNHQVTLTWTDPTSQNLSHIEITHDRTGGGVPIVVAAGVEHAVLIGLANDASYFFTLRTVSEGGERSLGAAVSATPAITSDTTAPAAVTGLAATPGDREIALSWTDPADPDLNHIEITHDQAGGDSPIVIDAAAQSAVLSGLLNDTAYTITVLAVDDAGNASAPATDTATPFVLVDITAPADVTVLNGTAGSGQVTLTWVDPVDADLNHIEITHTGAGGGTPIIIAQGTQTATVSGLTNGTSYTFTVRTVDASSNKSTGVQSTRTPTPLDVTPPQEVTGMAAMPGNGQVTLTWVDPPDSDFNHVEITHDQAGGTTPRVVGYGVETALIGGLRNGELYTFTLRTADTSDNVSTGAAIGATPTAGGGSVEITLVLNTPTSPAS